MKVVLHRFRTMILYFFLLTLTDCILSIHSENNINVFAMRKLPYVFKINTTFLKSLSVAHLPLILQSKDAYCLLD